MVGVYFSGTGNTRYCLEKFLSEYQGEGKSFSIEDSNIVNVIRENKDIVFAYPIYFSNLPKIVRDFIEINDKEFNGKNIFIISTMGLFSGDGSGCSARLFKKYGANILGGVHLKMPDCIGDEKVLKKSLEENKAIVKKAEEKIKECANKFKTGVPLKEGLGLKHHIIGLFGQRLWFYNKTRSYTDKFKIKSERCVGCGKCAAVCPMNNIEIDNDKARGKDKCTMCYRCFSNCPKQAITILGKEVQEQCKIEKYIK